MIVWTFSRFQMNWQVRNYLSLLNFTKKVTNVIPSTTPYPMVILISEEVAGIPSAGNNIMINIPKE